MDILSLSNRFSEIHLKDAESVKIKIDIKAEEHSYYDYNRAQERLKDAGITCYLDGGFLRISSNQSLKISFNYHSYSRKCNYTAVCFSFLNKSGKHQICATFLALEVHVNPDSVVKKIPGDLNYAAYYLCNSNKELLDDIQEAFALAFRTIASELPYTPKITLKIGSLSLFTSAISKRKKQISLLESRNLTSDHYVLIGENATSISELHSEIKYIENLKKEAQEGLHDIDVQIRVSEGVAFIHLNEFSKHEAFYEDAVILLGSKCSTLFYSNYTTEKVFRRLRKSDPKLYKLTIDGRTIDLKSITKEINRLKKGKVNGTNKK
ncbi:hypothetical protein LMH73_011075 [Vibrio splendidus]|nr:hypothetical protein [Vibrio splendidus]MCC4880768.1 hypothetical protein [Vibrio splendidus]